MITVIVRESRIILSERFGSLCSIFIPSADGKLDPVQALELALLVDLEARWENLPRHARRRRWRPSPTSDAPRQAESLRCLSPEAGRLQQALSDRSCARATAQHSRPAWAVVPGQCSDLYLRSRMLPQTPLSDAPHRESVPLGRSGGGQEGQVPNQPIQPAKHLRGAIRELESLIQWCAGPGRYCAGRVRLRCGTDRLGDGPPDRKP